MTLCTAHSKQTHAPCKQSAIEGGTVCRFHGGAAPQVRFKAAVNLEDERQRFMEGIPKAGDTLIALMDSDDDSVRLRAAQIVQERFWGKAQDKLKLSGDSDAPLEIIVSRPASSPSADQTSST